MSHSLSNGNFKFLVDDTYEIEICVKLSSKRAHKDDCHDEDIYPEIFKFSAKKINISDAKIELKGYK